MPERLTGRTALVTGASSGIGAAIARTLAQRGADLILVARRADALERLAAELRQSTGVTIAVRPADLADEPARIALAPDIARAEILVNNAGLGVYGSFADAAWDRLHQMLEVNVVALTHLTHLALPSMRERRWGRIMQVSSTAAFQPVPHYAAYAATKAHILSFGIALNHELRRTGVTCTTLCPGATESEFLDVSGQTMNSFQRASMMTSEAVARIGVDAMLRRRPYVVAGPANALSALGGRLIPPDLAAHLAARMMR
jgi:short-subunit dehydrogenase